ncbi:HIT domain-containing protein [Candidatus Daviesbacteria bacterium]|nr:HIT domain-containing protein [Candidatus Daviesbacteria bacterium]
MDCLFCKIINRAIPANIVYETDKLIAFSDINPSADIHILIVPKEHISGVHDLTDYQAGLLAKIYTAANKLVKKNNLEDNAYRIVVNGGRAQHVPHLHFHLLGGQWKKMI